MKCTRPHRFAKRVALRLIDVGNPKRWPKSLATLALLAIVRRVPPGAVRCRSLRSRHRPSPGLRRSLRSLNSFAKKKQAFSMAQELRKPGARYVKYRKYRGCGEKIRLMRGKNEC